MLAVCLVLFVVLSGCGDPEQPQQESGWWTPAPGEAANWDWQLEEPYDVSAPRAMYDLDLFELAPAGSELRYADGDVIELPAGPLAGTIDKLHDRSPRPVVICYVDTGAFEHYRPDAERFPGYREDIDDVSDGEQPEEGSVIGWDTGWEGERWLDIRRESWGSFAELMWARFDLAKRLGCDGVEPDQNNPVGNNPGFDISIEDQHEWYREVARQAHARGLSVGMKNGHDQPGSAAVLVEHFDWALPEECVQFEECAELDVFIEKGKAVFAVDYRESVRSDQACAEHREHRFDGLVKNEPPTSAHRRQCGP